MNLWGRLFGRNAQFDLASVRQEDIRADEIALERQEVRLDQEIEQCERRIQDVVQQTVEAGRKSKARVATRQILQLKERIADKEHALDTIGKSLIALGRLRRVVEGVDRLAPSGVLTRLQSLPQADLNRLLCGEMASKEAASRGLTAVLEMLEGPLTEAEKAPMSAEYEALLRTLETAIEAGDPSLVTVAVSEELEAERAAVLARAG